MISVRLRLHGTLRLLMPQLSDDAQLTLPAGATVADLLERYAQSQRPALVAVNQSLARPDRLLRDGDEIDLYPSVDGG